MDELMLKELEKSISKTRLTSYENFLGVDDGEVLISAYILNSKISEAFYFLLQNLEVTLRNAIYDSYTNNVKFDKTFFYIENEEQYNREFHSYACWKMISAVKYKLLKDDMEISDGKIISELNFGFWTKLLEEKQYKIKIWRYIFKDVFSYYKNKITTDKNVDNMSNIINNIRRFRNRIFHYEIIINKEYLDDMHEDILRVIGWINPAMRDITIQFDEYPTYMKMLKELN